jgi:arylformamidase
MKIYDISPLIHEGLGVFPGDQKFEKTTVMDFKSGDNLLLTKFLTTTHIGAHVDAPSHYSADGPSIDKADLGIYMGKAQVIKIQRPQGLRVLTKHLEGIDIKAPRVLIQTNSFPEPDQWNADFCGLSEEAVHFLAGKNVQLIGIDTPSMDPQDDSVLESHKAIDKTGLRILEGVVLNHVPEGVYFLIALPLKIKGAEASPVRAVLLDKVHFDQ